MNLVDIVTFINIPPYGGKDGIKASTIIENYEMVIRVVFTEGITDKILGEAGIGYWTRHCQGHNIYGRCWVGKYEGFED